jgi:hypothetical protein
MNGAFRVRLDPWEPEYEGAIQLPPDEEEPADVDLRVELDAWGAVSPPPLPSPGPIFFVDGVRRIEHRLLIETTPGPTHFGLLGSFAVGATQVTSQAAIVGQEIRRLAVVGGGIELARWEVRLPTGSITVCFDPLAVAENTPEAALNGLQNAMRECEARLAEALSADDSVVFLDGTLSFFTAPRLRVIGFVKTLLRSYLPADKSALLRELEVGQRTPVFLIKETRHQRYSWYARIARGRAIDSSLTGIVRLETSSALDLQSVRQLADLSAACLPRFASAPGRDPRAPQNLYPIAGLERTLRHWMGDTLVVRRAIEASLHDREGAA